jgi:hypothetical protein
MATTKFWTRFGDTIIASPHLTLAAFLGHAPSIAIANERSVLFPRTSDFQLDPAYDSNPHKLDLDEQSLQSAFFVRCLSVWGGEALIRAVNACSLLQCLHHSSCSTKYKSLRNAAAHALQAMVDLPSPTTHKVAKAVLLKCQAEDRRFENDPDTDEASEVWYCLGAPWCGLETALGNLQARPDCGEQEPGPSNATWCARASVWPERALDAAAHRSSHALARAVIKSALLAWATDQPSG